jgi:hypothetical protein
MSDKKPSTATPRGSAQQEATPRATQPAAAGQPSGHGRQDGQPAERDQAEQANQANQADQATGVARAAPTASELVEVFECDNDVVARLVIDEILGPQGVYAALHDRRSHSLPAPAAMAGVMAVAVPEHDAARARRMLRAAQQDKVLLDDGSIVGETVA